eukprot:TRINITY_DN1305_c5_g1_i1.p1 TRINITY_DN1305_c5_g1~~TRINITY_DN1305_c5_g1_i1.p1  ORF type:complete len:768 (+),score=316.67 TRINITY_DN1305_c5_g1_i1:1327-3630(+)
MSVDPSEVFHESLFHEVEDGSVDNVEADLLEQEPSDVDVVNVPSVDLDALQSEVTAFLDTAELATLSVSRKRKLESEAAESEAKLRAALAKIETLQSSRQQLEQDLHDSRGAKRHADETIAALERRLRDLHAEQVCDTGRLLEAQQAMQREAALHEQVHGQLRFVEAERAALLEQLGDAERQLRDAEEGRREAMADCSRMRTDLAEPLHQARLAASNAKREAEQRRYAAQTQQETLAAQCDSLRRDAERSRARADKHAADASRLQQQLDEERSRLRQLQTGMSSAEADTMVRALKGELEQYKARQAEFVACQLELDRHRSARLNVDMLHEQISALQAEKERAAQLYPQLLAAQRQLADIDQRRCKWERCTVLDEFSGEQQLADTLSDLRRTNLGLTDATGETSAELAAVRTSLTRLRSELDELRTEHGRTKQQAEHASEALHRQDRTLALLRRERDGLKGILESYTAEEAIVGGGGDRLKQRRIEELEALLAARDAHSTQLEQQLRLVANDETIAATMSAVQQQQQHSSQQQQQQENERLRTEIERLLAELAVAEHRLAAGEFNPATTKVLHLKDNPELRAAAQQLKPAPAAELERLRADNEALRGQLAQLTAAPADQAPSAAAAGGSVPRQLGQAPAHTLAPAPAAAAAGGHADELEALRTKHTRVKEAFTKKFQEYKEVVRRLFGYKVDVMGNNQYRLRSIYAEQEHDHLLLQSNPQGQLDLLETEFSVQLANEIHAFLNKCGSIPAFLSNVTMSLFDTKTFRLS